MVSTLLSSIKYENLFSSFMLSIKCENIYILNLPTANTERENENVRLAAPMNTTVSFPAVRALSCLTLVQLSSGSHGLLSRELRGTLLRVKRPC
jgi:hypothetical protein